MTARPGSHIRQTFSALRSRNFRLYLFGLGVSLTGTHMQLVAEGWLVYRLTNSAFTLGLVGFLAMVPLAPLTLVAGALADRLPRQTLLAFTQIGQVFPPLLLAALTWSHQVQVWHVVVIDLLMGALSALDQPARQALVVDAAPPEDWDNAVALSAASFSAARVIGPAVAGVLVAVLGEAVCFTVNGLSFLAVAMALAAMRLPKRERSSRPVSLGASLMESGRFLVREPLLLALIGLIVIIDLFVVPYQTLLPVFARDILKVGAVGLGFLTTAAGVGAIVGSLAAAYRLPVPRGRLIMLLGLGVSAVTWGFAFSQNFVLSCQALILVSGAVVALKVLAFAAVQSQVSDDLRGRVMSVVILFDAGAPRLGGLGAGFLAAYWGAPVALGVGALGCFGAVAALNWATPQVRQLE